MRQAIDSPQGRRLYSQRVATVEPVVANIRHHKRMSRFTLRGGVKVSTQRNLFCLVHNVEKIARYGGSKHGAIRGPSVPGAAPARIDAAQAVRVQSGRYQRHNQRRAHSITQSTFNTPR